MTESDPMRCPRCATGLQHMGTKKFHEGTRWSVFGELGELFENGEHFDVYMCPRCGRVELFVDGVGKKSCPASPRRARSGSPPDNPPDENSPQTSGSCRTHSRNERSDRDHDEEAGKAQLAL